MNDAVIVALLSLVGTLGGSFAGILTANRLTNYRIEQLEAKVEKDGVVTEMCQGKYNIDRTNPALQAYNNTIKNFASVVKQLNDMLPSENKLKDDFESFE